MWWLVLKCGDPWFPKGVAVFRWLAFPPAPSFKIGLAPLSIVDSSRFAEKFPLAVDLSLILIKLVSFFGCRNCQAA